VRTSRTKAAAPDLLPKMDACWRVPECVYLTGIKPGPATGSKMVDGLRLFAGRMPDGC
jgi:hypothetical protein